MTVEVCKESARWDAYVETMPSASNYHRWVWQQVIGETFGHRAYYLATSTGGEIRGVLPLVLMKSRLFGQFLVSVPFFSYGGVLASDAEARASLLAKASELARQLDASHIELRQETGWGPEDGWQDLTPKVTMEVPLSSNAEELWNALSAKLRKRIRYATKHGLVCRWDGGDAVRDFYSVFAANMRNLGTPVYPRQWFENIVKHLKDSIHVLTIWDGGRPVAGAFLVAFRGTLELPWAASLPDSRGKFSPLLLYWNLIEWAVQKGFRRVDLGRCTPQSGNYDFKRRFSSEERPLHWYYWLAPGAAVPHLRPDNPRYRLATWAWKRLPLPVANRLGPMIVRSIP